MIKHYSPCKDTGLDWLGVMPVHWDLKKLKFNASVQFSNVDKKTEEGEKTVRLCNYVDVYYNDTITPSIDFMQATATAEEIQKFRLNVGDVLVTKDSEEWNDIAIPAFVGSEFKDVICGYHLAQIRPNASLLDGKFLFYLLAAYRINYQFKIEATGVTRYGLSNYALSNSLVVIPPISEQKSITCYLDDKMIRIDEIIEKKERMIELLKEERIAIINQAVTKGLDPKIELKDSGIEWLGRIPKHWQTKRLKYLLNEFQGIKIGPFGSALKSEFIMATGYKVYGQENVIANDFNAGYRFINDEKFSELMVYELKSGDVIVTMMGTTGKAKVVPEGIERGIMDSHLIRMRFNNLAQPSFISLLINDSFYLFTQFKIYSKGSIMEGLNSSIIKSLVIALPPANEQEKIMQYLTQKLGEVDEILKKEIQGIDHLKEYRAALISEVVTGKIDVRSEGELKHGG